MAALVTYAVSTAGVTPSLLNWQREALGESANASRTKVAAA